MLFSAGMRREIVLDIETQNTFQDVGAYNPSLSVLIIRVCSVIIQVK